MTTNTFLTSSPLLSERENIECVSLQDLVYHEDLTSVVQFNFLFDVDFFMSNMHPKVKNTIPILLVHGLRESAAQLVEQAKKWSNIKVIAPYIRDRFGTHHSKAMILFYRDSKTNIESAQIIVMTANMIPQDWQLMTQGVYRSPKCFFKTNMDTTSSPFELDFIAYLNEYRLYQLKPIVAKLKQFDWSPCKAVIIASVPGYHRESENTFNYWGLEKLASTLRQYVDLPQYNYKGSQIIMQCSSLPHSPERWFKDDLCQAMSEFKNKAVSFSAMKTPAICVVYPTINDAIESFTGREDSGGFLRFDKASYDRNHSWFDKYLYEWQSENAGRQFMMPHIKTYTRTYQDKNDKTFIAWHVLTSANMSRAAWGEYQKKRTQIYIKSFELGVFFAPSLWENTYLVPNNDIYQEASDEEEKDEDIHWIKVRLPYDLPLVHQKPLQCFTRLP